LNAVQDDSSSKYCQPKPDFSRENQRHARPRPNARRRCAGGHIGTIAQINNRFSSGVVLTLKNGSLENKLRGCIRKNHMKFYIFMPMNPSQGVAQCAFRNEHNTDKPVNYPKV
jgi:hypothetical protein